jgi:peptidoglycan/xylan/chitin deacetylase (PgdA/CDA1 family)
LAGLKKLVLRTGMEALYFSGAHRMLRPLLGGVGAILTLHHVRPPRADAFQPNRLLEVSPQFLEDVIRELRRSDVDIVPLDEAHRRLKEQDFRRRFVCLTFDDGYRDNTRYAVPILRKYEAPFAIYIPTSFPDRAGELWWLTLEAAIARVSRLALVMNGEDRRYDCHSTEEKYELFEHIYWWLRSLESEDELRDAVRDLGARYGVDSAAICNELCMTWEEIAEVARDPLATIGAHTVNHVMLRKASDEAVRSEMQTSAATIEAALGKRPRHWSAIAPRRVRASSGSPRRSGSRQPSPRGPAFCSPSMPRT